MTALTDRLYRDWLALNGGMGAMAPMGTLPRPQRPSARGAWPSHPAAYPARPDKQKKAPASATNAPEAMTNIQRANVDGTNCRS